MMDPNSPAQTSAATHRAGWRGACLVIALAAVLGGCASTRSIDTEVRSFAQWPSGQAPASGTYRFERLPSQQSFGERQAAVEKAAGAALQKVGFRLDERGARYSVQVGVRADREARSAWEEPFPMAGVPGRDYVITGAGQLIWTAPPAHLDSPWYKRQASVIVRDLSSGQVVYETHAVHQSRWADVEGLLPAMFEAALAGFPAAPQGPRRVDVPVQPLQPAQPAPKS